MKEVMLIPKYEIKVPVEAELIRPDVFAGKTIEELSAIKVREGNRISKLGELFHIKGEPGPSPSETKIVIEGDVSKVWRVGEKMKDGQVVIKGNAGAFIGQKMEGGSIVVEGNVDMFLGAKMKGGTIEVFGSALDAVGACYRGEKPGKGMKGGTIIIHGDAGAEVGRGMKSGLIIIEGKCGPMPGVNMKGGTICVKGSCEGKPGARMISGKLVICGHVSEVLSSFYIEDYKDSVKVGVERIPGPFLVFSGDVLANPKCEGKLFISEQANPHLKPLLEYLKPATT
ncbi:MAG: formylmethanofuran dehydrogenase subunit C [Candidatus Methanomethylicota archaeon]|uniref:formylmethanofuran dehydrogenase n=2 Tax=Thermoproteota archaeon TaxID=2056631 RepID=A0A497ERF0_9CREN|nr:MAG: formylmethanofuran dehydrogenase subunit C [Candidatus Verstraetearchaeota archaeon]